MKITIETYGNTYSATLGNDSNSSEAQETFDRLLIQAGYSNDIRCADGGHYELKYVSEDEERPVTTAVPALNPSSAVTEVAFGQDEEEVYEENV